MREIKFRAWDKSEDMMLRDISIQDDTWDMLNSFFKYKSEDELEFMQYTGFKDKNGVEVYEGDILKYDFMNKGREKLLVAKWLDVDGMWDFNGVQPQYAVRYGEVIGNIYENQELLK